MKFYSKNDELLLNLNNSGDHLANITFKKDNLENTEINSIDNLSIGHKIKNLLDDLQETNTTDCFTNNSNLKTNDKNLEVDKKTEILTQNSGNNFETSSLNSEIVNNKVFSEIRQSSKDTVEKNSQTRFYNNSLLIKPKMTLRSMLHQPQPFSGGPEQDIDVFFENFDLAAIINEWGEFEKITLLPLYLKDMAGKFFKIIKIKNSKITWDEAKTQLIDRFTVVGNKKLLKLQLDQRKLEKRETISEFVINIIGLCNKIDLQMDETEICEKILSGLPDDIYDKIDMLDNTNIHNLEANLKNVESSKLIRNKNTNSNDEVNKLRREMELLRNHIENLNITQSNQNNFNKVIIIIVIQEIEIIYILGKVILLITIIIGIFLIIIKELIIIKMCMVLKDLMKITIKINLFKEIIIITTKIIEIIKIILMLIDTIIIITIILLIITIMIIIIIQLKPE